MIETICTYQGLSRESHRTLALCEDENSLQVCLVGILKLKHYYTDNAEQKSSIVTYVTKT